jgi:rSAM/selenodomain-associated transferase 1
MKKAIIIFQKNEILGKVKTRLANDVGHAKAMEIYQFLVSYTHKILKDLPVEKFIFYSDFIEENNILNSNYTKLLQQGDDLGERMFHAFQTLFKKGYQSVVIIGTDCYELNKEHIENAFESLETFDFVIGPAKDGGYYLLGSTFLEATIFMGKIWSSDSVYKETLQNFDEIGLDYTILETLSDIDSINDLKDLRQTFNI